MWDSAQGQPWLYTQPLSLLDGSSLPCTPVKGPRFKYKYRSPPEDDDTSTMSNSKRSTINQVSLPLSAVPEACSLPNTLRVITYVLVIPVTISRSYPCAGFQLSRHRRAVPQLYRLSYLAPEQARGKLPFYVLRLADIMLTPSEAVSYIQRSLAWILAIFLVPALGFCSAMTSTTHLIAGRLRCIQL